MISKLELPNGFEAYAAADIDPILRDAREIAVFCHDKLFSEGSEMHKKARRIIDATEGADND
jgi:hypothetical protein